MQTYGHSVALGGLFWTLIQVYLAISWQPSPTPRRVGRWRTPWYGLLRILRRVIRFKACSVFTRVLACTFARTTQGGPLP